MDQIFACHPPLTQRKWKYMLSDVTTYYMELW